MFIPVTFASIYVHPTCSQNDGRFGTQRPGLLHTGLTPGLESLAWASKHTRTLAEGYGIVVTQLLPYADLNHHAHHMLASHVWHTPLHLAHFTPSRMAGCRVSRWGRKRRLTKVHFSIPRLLTMRLPSFFLGLLGALSFSSMLSCTVQRMCC